MSKTETPTQKQAKAAYNKAYREANPERWAEYRRRAAVKRAAAIAADPTRTPMRVYKFLKQYGLTIDQFEALLAAQGHACAICSQPLRAWVPRDERTLERPCIDHDHVTGKVRGILCTPCNLALGYLKDDPALFGRAIDYLKEATSECQD
jgi:hypothetical protein